MVFWLIRNYDFLILFFSLLLPVGLKTVSLNSWKIFLVLIIERENSLYSGVWVVALFSPVGGRLKMDLWVVAAATGAGYLAKYWNRLSSNSDSSSQLSLDDSNFESTETPSPFHRKTSRDELGKNVTADRRASSGKFSDANSLDSPFTTRGVASNDRLEGEKLRHFGNHLNSNILSLSNLPLALSVDGNLMALEDSSEQIPNVADSNGIPFYDSSVGEVGSIHRSAGNKISLRTKHFCGHYSRPVNSLESCLIAQLYKEHAKMEEYVYSSLSSPSTSMRPLLVSDGSRIISRTSDNSFRSSIGSDDYKLLNETILGKDGIPSLPKIGSIDDLKKTKFKAGKRRSGRLSSCNNFSSVKSAPTQYDATFIFSLGISFGMITSIMANKRELDKLKELLKQTENLVQDLQEELDMRDSMTVKELNNENYGPQDTCNHSLYDKELNGFSPENHMDNSPRNDSKELHDQKAEESSEAMSKIEAELEAELERLGLNMNTSSLDRRLSELVEIDPDFAAEFSQGELRADTVKEKAFGRPKSNDDACDTSTTFPANYTVSPRELSLRLHEVIQSRLEERVQELEIALQNSQRKIQLMELEREVNYQRDSSSCGRAYSFARETPLTKDDSEAMAHPLVMHLSGEALDAYNEAYEELIQINDSEEDSPSEFHYEDNKEALNPHVWRVSEVQHVGANGSMACTQVDGETRMSKELSSGKLTMMEEPRSQDFELNFVTGDENCDCDHEFESQLIKQIVERTKKGSHVFQNAQRLLHSMDKDEH